ncbi:unnamed protein product [Protopolystoma xenopodis]|uniref:Ig-like domain-containing protein n=1 Tax=Protopolystoma xenopodis TaxID=117903 RepID=A0A3S5FD04_9PLAT|nr:unnamed protein product [Protopolystoma xenopodis]
MHAFYVVISAWLCTALPVASLYMWGSWGDRALACSVTCGLGTRCRKRMCLSLDGHPQTDTTLCSLGDDPAQPQDLDCRACILNSHCPTQPGWGVWAAWSECRALGQAMFGHGADAGSLNLTNVAPRGEASRPVLSSAPPSGCLKGVRTRVRPCNSPPPDLNPNAPRCPGSGEQALGCNVKCSDEPTVSEYDIANRIRLQMESDHLTRRLRLRGASDEAETGEAEPTVFYRMLGDTVRLDCATPAVRLADELLGYSLFGIETTGLGRRRLSLRWYHNGRLLQQPDGPKKDQPATRQQVATGFTRHEKTLWDVETSWRRRMPPSSGQRSSASLVIERLGYADQGVYVCELSIGTSAMAATFFSVHTRPIEHRVEALQSFHLHSNLGVLAPLLGGVQRLPVIWYDAAQLVWYHNGREVKRGLARLASLRVMRVDRINETHQGEWLCYLEVPVPDRPAVLADAGGRQVQARFLTAQLLLRVLPPRRPNFWNAWQPSSNGLRSLAVWLLVGNFVVSVGLLLTGWALIRWRRHAARQTDVRLRGWTAEVVEDELRHLIAAREQADYLRAWLMPMLRATVDQLGQLRRRLNLPASDSQQVEDAADYATETEESQKKMFLEASEADVTASPTVM